MTDLVTEKPNDKLKKSRPCDLGRPVVFAAGRHRLPLGDKTYLMGILNTTPDSFSDGGAYLSRDRALLRAEEMIRQGADILDVGGESTRPGSQTVPAREEAARVAPVIEAIVKQFDIPVSIDTYKYEVAKTAIEAGACMINDIYGLLHDDRLALLAAVHKTGLIMMHNARLYRHELQPYAGADICQSGELQLLPVLQNRPIHEAVYLYLEKSIAVATKAGVRPEAMMLDPGIGFGVNTLESVSMIQHICDLHKLNKAILIGPSRKRFIGDITNRDVHNRQFGTAAAVVAGVAGGVDFVRVHDIAQIKDALLIADQIYRT